MFINKIKNLNDKKKYLIFSTLMLFSYNFLMTIYYLLIENLGLYDNEIYNLFFESNPQFLDAIFCILVFFIYLPFHIWSIKENKKYEEKNKLKKFRLGIKGILVCVLIAIGISGLSGLWLNFSDIYLSDISFISDSLESFEVAFDIGVSNTAYIWDFISIVLFGPIVEEMMFRSFIYTNLSKFKRGAFAIIISGILFGVWHMLFVQSVYAAVMGIIIALVYYYTKNMFYPMLIHIFNNFMSTLPPFIDTDEINMIIESVQFLFIIPMLFLIYILYIKRKNLDMMNEFEF